MPAEIKKEILLQGSNLPEPQVSWAVAYESFDILPPPPPPAALLKPEAVGEAETSSCAINYLVVKGFSESHM